MSGIQRLAVTVSLVALAWAAPAVAHAAPDTTPPALTSLSLPKLVMAGPVAADVVVRAGVEDASGLEGADCPGPFGGRSSILLQAPTRMVSLSARFDSKVGSEYQAVVHLPRYAEAGRWTVHGVALTDCAGNARIVLTKELFVRGFPIDLAVAGQSDLTPPVLRELRISPASVDVSDGSVEVTVEATISDDLSGVALADMSPACGAPGSYSSVSFRSPRLFRSVSAHFERIKGDVYSATLRVPRYSVTGTWTIGEIVLGDCAQNRDHLGSHALAQQGLPNSFAATGQSDTSPPDLTSLAVSPSVVDTRAGKDDVVFEAKLVDDVSGVASLESGPECYGTAPWVVATPPAGPAVGMPFELAGGVFRAALRLERFSEPGMWTFSVHVSDCAQNRRELSPAELEALGLPSSFVVLQREYDFGGFARPLSATELATRKHGSAMTVAFALGGAMGGNIFDAGFPAVQAIDCTTRQPLGDAMPLGPAEWSFLRLENGVFEYRWKSPSSWVNVCRRLILGFDDGTRYSADVRFT
jgi:hypothetical protein